MKVFLGADHRGYNLKEKIARWLLENSFDFVDVGAQSLNPKDDYTKYAAEVASLVANSKENLGILLCGSGVGVDVTSNKFDGVRAAIGKTPEQVSVGRRDDDMNILVLAADFTEENEALKMVKIFLETPFEPLARHKKRLAEIAKIEANN
jgi:ribose 5-phosphate isomerase B